MITVGISNRHVHLNEEDKNILFGKSFNLQVRRYLKQKGEFASESVVTLKTDKGSIPNVRVIGPIREYTQVEILKSDEETLGLKAPMRNSGDLRESASVIIIGPNGHINKKNCVIIANRHIHIPPSDIKKYGLKDKDIVSIKSGETIIDNVHIKSNPTCVLECHLDKDDADKYKIQTGDLISIVGDKNG